MSNAKNKLADFVTCVVVSVPIALFAASAPACSSNNPSASVLDISSFASAYAQALCTSLQHCCDENLVSYDYKACSTGWQANIQQRFINANANYDGKAANNCITAIRASQSASCVPGMGSVSDARDVCQSVFAGQQPIGGACTSSADCSTTNGRAACGNAPVVAESGLLPLDLTIQTQLVCTAVAPVAAGEPCALTAGQVGVTDCGDGLYCDPTSLQCTTDAEDGATCVTGGCVAGDYCATLKNGGRACAMFATAGLPCDAADQCDPTTRCDLAGTKTCVSKSDAGTACANDVDCVIGTCDVTTKKCLMNSFATTAACNGAGP